MIYFSLAESLCIFYGICFCELYFVPLASFGPALDSRCLPLGALGLPLGVLWVPLAPLGLPLGSRWLPLLWEPLGHIGNFKLDVHNQ